MAVTKDIYTRVKNKHDYEKNWVRATTFIPLEGELIIYDADTDAPTEVRGTHRLPRIKIGDGKKFLKDLDFVLEETLTEDFNNRISCGTADPNSDITSQFYFKYSE